MQRYTIQDVRSDVEYLTASKFTDDQFKNLLKAFKAYCKRKNLYTPQAVSKAVRRAWMTSQMAYYFKKYATQ